MKAKSFVLLTVLLALLVVLAVAGVNYFVDPFDVFGNNTWYSFSQTLNPRVAKTTYLMEHSNEYDSYLIGCSSTSGYPKDALDAYLDASFYNTICYGADMSDTRQTCKWLLENCTVKNVVLNVYIDNGLTYQTGEDSLSYKLHCDVSGKNPASFYLGYLMASPSYALDKIQAQKGDTVLPQSFDVFDERSGAYDKRARDTENIGALVDYYEAYPVFTDYPEGPSELSYVSQCMQDVAAIRAMCEEKGVKLIVVVAPVYCEYFEGYTQSAIKRFYTELAAVTPYWDFSYSSVSCEPRYFYDATHFRNDVGKMALARIFEDSSVYVPDDFGVYVTEQNVQTHVQTLCDHLNKPDDAAYTVQVPVLTYHNLLKEDDGTEAMTEAVFEEQMQALLNAGYTAVSLSELYEYVYHGAKLAEKPILITFDDGYLSNYEIAYPILQKYGMKAAIFCIGVSFGKDTYKDTGAAICPHFSYEQARQMVASGVIEIGSHTYDFHQSAEYDAPPVRENCAMLPGETQQAYYAAFSEDLKASMQGIADELGNPVTALAYPEGVYTALSQIVCKEQGILATFTTEPKVNTLVRGLSQSLYGLGRFSVSKISGEELIRMLK